MSATMESTRLREMPKRIVKAPKPPTHQSMVTPARRRKGRCASSSAMLPAPIAGDARSRASPQGPVRRTSLANTGSSATAPPSSTANRSSEIDPRMIFFSTMMCRPRQHGFHGQRFPGPGLGAQLDLRHQEHGRPPRPESPLHRLPRARWPRRRSSPLPTVPSS